MTQLDTSHHLPCPFCGIKETGYVKGAGSMGVFIAVKCENCGARTGLQRSREDADIAWNTRIKD